jgi:hypothetical protein
MIARWKDLSEEYNFWMRNIIYDPCCSPFSQKTSFRASKWPQKLKTAKNSKLPKLPKTCFGPIGEGGWPPISTWITGPHDIRWFFGTWFFADGFLFPVKELGFCTNPGHWVRVLDAAGSYMYIVL